jgi:hypothetical protein
VVVRRTALRDWPGSAWPKKTRRIVEAATKKPALLLSDAERALLLVWIDTPGGLHWCETGEFDWTWNTEGTP